MGKKAASVLIAKGLVGKHIGITDYAKSGTVVLDCTFVANVVTNTTVASGPYGGGGIAAAMRAGRFCAETVHQGFACNNLSASFLKQYEKMCYQKFGKGHDFQLKFRKFLLALNKQEQIGLYKVLQGFALSGYKKTAFLKSPIQSAKYLTKFIKFKG